MPHRYGERRSLICAETMGPKPKKSKEEIAAEKAAREEEERIAAEKEKKRLEEEELNRLRDLLWGEELEAKRKAEEDGRIAARASQKAEMAKANKQMLAAKAEKRAVEMAEEQKLIEQLEAHPKFAADLRAHGVRYHRTMPEEVGRKGIGS